MRMIRKLKVAPFYAPFAGLIFFAFGLSDAFGSVLYVDLNSANPTPPYADWSTAATNIQDTVDASTNGDLILVTNGVYQTGGRVVSGFLTNRLVVDKAVTVQSANGAAVTTIQGYQDPTQTIYAPGKSIRCVYLTNHAVVSGFTLTGGGTELNDGDRTHLTQIAGGGAYCWSTNEVLTNCVIFANTAGLAGGGIYSGTVNSCVIKSNTQTGQSSIYGGGGAYLSTLNNCLVISNLTVESEGGGESAGVANNCLFFGNTSYNGGGANKCVLNSCILSNNFASNDGGGFYGSGPIPSLLTNCLIVSNKAGFGGGCSGGELINCTVVGNAGGGAYATYSNINCIIYYNSPLNYGAVIAGTFYNCCTTPLFSGNSNITNEPVFMNPSAGDFRLQTNSSCINAGNNAYVTVSTDLDGNPRIKGGTVDIGAYEFQSPTSVISYAWLQQYGLPTDGSADFIDTDNDDMNNWQEWIAGTDPTNPLSVLKMLAPSNSPSGIAVNWESVGNRTYFLQSSTNLGAQPAFSTIQSNILGQAGTTTFTNTNAANSGPHFYRVGVQL